MKFTKRSESPLDVIISNRLKDLNIKSYEIPDLEFVSEMIRAGIDADKEVFIVGDYDCDGVFSTAILIKTLQYLGCAPKWHIPRRFSEGYGLNSNIIDEVAPGSLLITLDNGIVAFAAIEKAKAKGCDVIVIDHHLRSESGEYPDADLIIDPNAVDGQCEFTGYCGAGLAYKLAETIGIPESLLKEMRVLAAYGTIADCVPLVGENHLIAEHLAEGYRNIGLNALIDFYQIYCPDENSAGFKICPTLNAAGRLLDDGAEKSLSLLLAETDEEAAKICNELVELNETRKELTDISMEKALLYIQENDLQDDNALCVLSDIPEGIVGIVAGRLTELYKVPAFVFAKIGTKDGKSVIKGSARTYGDNHLKNVLDSASEILLKYGGHAAAAGLSMYEENLPEFRKKMNSLCTKSSDAEEVLYDVDLKPIYLAEQIEKTLEQISVLAPFGQDNPPLVFRINGCRLYPQQGKYFKTMGKDDRYYKLFGRDFDILCFDGFKEDIEKLSERIDVVGYISENVFNKKSSYQIEAISLQIKEEKAKETDFKKKIAARAAERRI